MILKLDRGDDGSEYTNEKQIIACVATAHLNKLIQNNFEKRYGIILYESYGLSETLFVSTNSPKNKTNKGVGELLDRVEIDFLDDQEIAINVPWMFKGYLIEEKNNFKGKKFRSGDIGKIDDIGFLYITGRKKDLIIRGGINISPRRIEEFINECDIFEENVIIGIEDPDMGEKTVCFFVPKSNYDAEKRKELNRQITTELGRDYHIDDFYNVDKIPTNINGKVDKFTLRGIYCDNKG